MLRLTLFFLVMSLAVASPVPGDPSLRTDHLIQPRDFVTDILNKIVEVIRGRMKDGFPEVNIPPLDPLTIRNLSIDTKDLLGKLGHLKINIHDVVVEGIPKFKVDNVKAQLLQMFVDMNITVPEITIKGGYEVDGRLHILPIFGQGPFLVTLKDMHIRNQGYIKLLKGNKVQLQTMNLDIDPGTLDIFLEGLLGGGDINSEIHQLINDMGNKLLRKVIPLISTNLGEKAKDILNIIIQDIQVIG